MVLDGLRGYIQLANGLTEVTRDRARTAARSLLAQGEARVDAVVPSTVRTQVGALTEDLLATSRTNRDLLLGLVRAEVERSVARLGLVAAAELEHAGHLVEDLEGRVADLERRLREQSSAAGRPGAGSAATKSTAKRSTAKASPTKSTAKKSSAKTSTAKTSTTSATKSSATKTSKRSGPS